MSVSVNPPKTPVTKGSKGVAAVTMPNVCKMPGPPAPFVLTALPNVGRSGDSPKGYTKNVKVGGQPVAIRGASFKSKGDAASKGTGGGLVSANTHGPTTFAGPGSRNVKFEGKNVQLLGDPMLNNCNPAGRLPNSATMVGLVQASGVVALVGDEVCALCGKKHDDAGKLEETVDTRGDMDVLTEAAKRAAEMIAFFNMWDNEIVRHKAKDRASAVYNARLRELQKQRKGAMGAGLENAVAHIDILIAKLQINVPQVPARKEGLAGMLGVLRCKDGAVYAGISSFQRKELENEMPTGWHTPTAGLKNVQLLEDFQKHVSNKAQFAEEWDKLVALSQRSPCDPSDPSYDPNAPPYYPPGKCAAPKVLALALEHGARPVGLTERYYSSSDDNAKVEVLYRDSVDAPPRKREFGGQEAVPPCGTCEILLTMLMCDRSPECQHRAPNAGVCRCT